MYRITKNWYQGNCVGYYPRINTDRSTDMGVACTIVGDLQEQGMFTSLTLTRGSLIIRSNPNYSSASQQSLMIQSPFTRQKQHIYWSSVQLPGWPDAAASHTIVCHYSLPSSSWLVTGALNGTVAVWDLERNSLVRMWHGHRGRVLCISMNDEVVLSGGSDSMIQVWDLEKTSKIKSCQRPTQRGMIDISRYLSERSDWYQGVGEIAIHRDLVACAPDASGPILLFSLLTGSLVYELQVPQEPIVRTTWAAEDITTFTRLCLTPFFLLTRGRISNKAKDIKTVPSTNNVFLERKKVSNQKPKKAGYITVLSDHSPPPVAQMTPYQLYLYYQSLNNGEESNGRNDNSRSEEELDSSTIPETSACIHVWDLQTGKIAYRLLPILPNMNQHYSITDIQLSPDYSKVFASIQIRGQTHSEEHLYCWDFSSTNRESSEVVQDFKVLELDSRDPIQQKIGKSWVCFM
ncbi:hypothetical protein G6F43_004374 [Rhizopus delemar]|nr:hypothetical protein G6F43_004374 [Rhizopus delemar]